ncbi:helix-turn-helix domain-containing protein [Pseudobutyrivibrio sp.]|jgi:transcriptional regulator with XRE-family HTH domain|uniref:helix-turn-helix domain-containing protein n=1 Tax=Pseudobutyrivibrio sp. TaxID=2014367 RepID=UPI001D35A7F5|nr:helix-turn-helix transcriptional regulator [Pseudobutyrivibrio sp.]MBE5911146.1 helix-turn-helix transcriptional regulator [Pseudobutyrivibrio sp.]
MFINKTQSGKCNICGPNVKIRRKEKDLSQRQFAEKLQLLGLEIDKNAIQRIECGKRFVIDTELKTIAKALDCSVADLLEE